jgi:hypothetical protein
MIDIEYRGKTLIIDAKYYSSSLQTNTQYGNQTIHSHIFIRYIHMSKIRIDCQIRVLAGCCYMQIPKGRIRMLNT